MNKPTIPTPSFLDPAAILDRIEGDLELLHEIAHVYIQNYPPLLAEIRAAISSGDSRALYSAAHTLKSAVGTFEAPSAVQAIVNIEAIASSTDLSQALEALLTLEAQLAQLERELVALTSDPAFAVPVEAPSAV